jgi:hypothetical protein
MRIPGEEEVIRQSVSPDDDGADVDPPPLEDNAGEDEQVDPIPPPRRRPIPRPAQPPPLPPVVVAVASPTPVALEFPVIPSPLRFKPSKDPEKLYPQKTIPDDRFRRVVYIIGLLKMKKAPTVPRWKNNAATYKEKHLNVQYPDESEDIFRKTTMRMKAARPSGTVCKRGLGYEIDGRIIFFIPRALGYCY